MTSITKRLYWLAAKKIFYFVIPISLAALLPSVSKADAVEVQVGYADNLRPTPFFPLPWQGSPNTIFAGAGPDFDAGAIRVINNGAVDFTINALVVDSFENGASFALWGGFFPMTVHPGESAIFTQTSEFDFDTSDQPQHDLPASSAQPQVHLTIDGTVHDFTDTAQVLNTEGSDHLALNNLNESHQWRDIGTFGGQAGDVPEPSSLVLFGSAILGFAGYRYRRYRRS